MPGAFTSLVIVTLLIVYAVYRCNILFNRIDPQVSKQSFMRNLDLEGAIKPGEMEFDFAFGIGVPLDPSIGYYSASIVHFYYEEKNGTTVRTKEKIPLLIEKCTTDNFNYPNKEEITMFGIDTYMCFTNKSWPL